MKKFECDVIDCEGYSDVLIITAKDYKECRKILINNYHVREINEIYCLNDYE